MSAHKGKQSLTVFSYGGPNYLGVGNLWTEENNSIFLKSYVMFSISAEAKQRIEGQIRFKN